MKKITGAIGKLLSFVFAALVIAYTSLLTLSLAQRIVPENPILQYMTLVLFDGAAIVWFTMFIGQAKGTGQWAVAGVGFLVGLLGAVVMAGGELIMGQSLVVVDDPARMGWILVATVIIAALAHATLIYAFHFLDPEVKNRIENSQQISEVIETSYADARAEIDRNRESMGRELAQSLIYEARQRLLVQSLPHIRRAAELSEAASQVALPPVVDAVSRDTNPEQERLHREAVLRHGGTERDLMPAQPPAPKPATSIPVAQPANAHPRVFHAETVDAAPEPPAQSRSIFSDEALQQDREWHRIAEKQVEAARAAFGCTDDEARYILGNCYGILTPYSNQDGSLASNPPRSVIQIARRALATRANPTNPAH